MKVYFEKTVLPCVVDDVIAWHVARGWVWDVVEVKSGRRVGVFFCTLLCGDGAVCHFITVPGIAIPWQTTLAAFRKAIRMVSPPAVNVLFATIPACRSSLVRCAGKLGFRPVSRYTREDQEILLLQYFPADKRYIKTQTRQRGNETSNERHES